MPINCAGSTGAPTSDAVDIFDATKGTWSTAALSVARLWLAATSLPNAGLAIFAGGTSAYGLIFVNTGGGLFGLQCIGLNKRVVMAPHLLIDDASHR
jgi:hypothetical protein